MAVIKTESKNVVAFLDMIAYSEGTKDHGDDGYNVMVGYKLFDDYSMHPNQRIFVSKSVGYSTAAGRYQILSRYWDAYKKQLGLPDFSPLSQDKYTINMFKETGAYKYIIAGDILKAIQLCSSRWASLPGAGYNQLERSVDALISKYLSFGGTLKDK